MAQMAEQEPGGLDRELVCVLFPGLVKNDEKALQCLGGLKAISQVYCQPTKKRLGLSYQPDNPFVKKVFADTKKAAGILLKVKVKKVKVNGEIQRNVISTDVVGKVSKMYRSDKPIQYSYTDKRYPDRSGSPSNDDFHKKCRSERGMPLGHWWCYNSTEEFPSEPLEYYIKNRDMRYEYSSLLKKEFEIIEKTPHQSSDCFFENAGAVLCPPDEGRSLEEHVGAVWIRPEEGTVGQDVSDSGVHSMVMTRDQIVHYKKADRVRQLRRKNRDEPLPSEEPAPDATCHEKYGWLPPKAIDICRDHIFRHVKETLLATHNTSLKFDEAMSSDDEDDYGDGDINEMDDNL
ncbi:General transcription factor 3C polypeptide 5 [Operophtera brumata]|uniref:General transcription factor 3C polypeptide 5 n=1 Tax=Operophtera brumata TaxID=104452 RepID=A0A0L7L6K6_OPEBR|nr:General transcription factor 3C polypeptide 5 [Operophtera brumata]